LTIGKDVIGLRKKNREKTGRTPKTKKTYCYKSHYKRTLSEIEKIKTTEQVGIVEKMIQEAYSKRRITYVQFNILSSKLNEKTSKVGEKKFTVKAGPLEFGVEKKGKVI